MSFNLEVVNTGVSANDGLGDPLRTAFSKSHNNDVTLSGEIIDLSGVISGRLNNTGNNLQNQFDNLSGDLQLEYGSGDNATGQSLLSTIDDTGQYIHNNFVSGYVQNFVFDMPESGQSVVVSGLKSGTFRFDEYLRTPTTNHDSLYRGRYTLTLTERHIYYHDYVDSPVEDWMASGAWYAVDAMNYPVGSNHTSDIYIFEFPVTNIGNHFEGGNHEYTIRLTGDDNTTHDPRWVITRNSTHTYAPLTGHGEFSPNNDASNHNRRHELIVNLVEY
mgnify:CR=1 FL=1|tara:strand:- start:172 stop:993 length:822 start_codon:yes stop_codon:yes gene_type:complete